MTTIIDMREHIRQSNLIENVKDEAEIPKSLKAWEYLCNCDKLTIQNVLDIHTLVMTDRLNPEDVGAFRRWNVQVGKYVAPSHMVVSEMMNQWVQDMSFYQDIDPKLKHIDFERIHPFRDGNGRIGRLLMWWHEMKIGKEPTFISYEDRFSYYDWFETRYR
jgi:Fic family protein